jgi:hypothetical protein
MYILGYPESSGSSITTIFPSVIAQLIFISVLPGIGEELFIRGTVLPGLKNRNYFFAIIISALLFSIMHGNVLQTVHQFGLGMVLAYIVLCTGDIKYAMILHLLNNAISILSSEYIPQIDGIAFGWWQLPVGIALVIVSAFLLVATLKTFKNISLKKAKDSVSIEGNLIDEVYEDGSSSRDNALKQTFRGFARLFKKGGFKQMKADLNADLSILSPLRPPEEIETYSFPASGFLDGDFVVKRDTAFPASLKLAFILVTLVWLVTTALSFANIV